MIQAGHIILPVWDHIVGKWVITERKGRLFDVDGKTIELFTLPVLANTIRKRDATLRHWEREGKFPAPMYRLPSRTPYGFRRYYSKVQIANIRAVYKKTAMRITRGNHHELWARFFEDTWKVFFLLEMTDAAKKGDVR